MRELVSLGQMLILVVLLSACGQKGALYLPEDESPQQATETVEDPAPQDEV